MDALNGATFLSGANAEFRVEMQDGRAVADHSFDQPEAGAMFVGITTLTIVVELALGARLVFEH